MLEELARDVTGWGAHAVEFFGLLGWSQCIRNHVRLHSIHGAEIRSVEGADRINGPFDAFSHTADVRQISALFGWHNIKNIGFFLWRLRSYEAESIDARRLGAVGDFRYHFSPLGNDTPLYTRWRREGDEAGLATEFHAPGPIRPTSFCEDLRGHRGRSPAAGYTEFYGLFDLISGSALPLAPAASLMVVLHTAGVVDAVPPDRVCYMDLEKWAQPKDDLIGIDVKRGRLALGPLLKPDRAEVFYHYGFGADLGGGPYRRRAWLVKRNLATLLLYVDKSGAAGTYGTIGDALNKWVSDGKPDAIISIGDNRTYNETLSIEPADGRWLTIEAADECRPHLHLNGPLTIIGNNPDATVTLSGLLIEGTIDVQDTLGRLRIIHTTLAPGGSIAQTDPPSGPSPPTPASVTVAGGTTGALKNQEMRLEIAFSIVGPLRVPAHADGIWALDSIIDGGKADAIAAPSPGDSPGPPLWLERVTIFGRTRAQVITQASEAIFDSEVIVGRQQVGCVRFSFVPEKDSVTPKRYRCQPDLEIAAQIEAAEAAALAAGDTIDDADRAAIAAWVRQWLAPAYTSKQYGDPEYAQLRLSCPSQIAMGAEDGSEMGAFCHLKQPQREANLRLRVKEYLPFGLETGLIYVT